MDGECKDPAKPLSNDFSRDVEFEDKETGRVSEDDEFMDDDSGEDCTSEDGLTPQSQAEFKLLEREWELRLDVIEKDGFRAGVETGRDKQLQEGFNIGYKTAAERIYKLSKCKGVIDALVALHNGSKLLKLSEDDIHELQTLAKEVDPLTAAVKASTQVPIALPGCDKDTCCGGTCKGDQDNTKETSSDEMPRSSTGDDGAESSAHSSGPSTILQQKQRGQIAYELGDCKKIDFSQVSKEIDSLHDKIWGILAKHDILNFIDMETSSQS